jgi:integrase/recombinase XerD
MLNSYIHCPDLIKEAEYIPNGSLQLYIHNLEQNGYTQDSIHQYVGAVLHFSRFLRQKEVSCANARQGDKTEFINFHLNTCKCPNGFPRSKKSNAAALSHWLRLIGHEPDTPMSIYKQDERVDAFDRYLNEVAGLSSATRLYRCRYASEFLQWLSHQCSIELKSLTFGDLSSYITLRSADVSLQTTASIAYSLNSFLRFLSMQGSCSLNVTLCVPHPKLLYSFPSKQYLSTKEISRLLYSVDRDYPAGKRDFAIMRCLIDLGLRTSEVAGLKMRDINWRNDTLTLSCVKLRRQRKLPVPEGLKLALVDYITHARPETQAPFIFVYHRAPLGQPVKVSTIRGVARRAFTRAGFPSSQSQVHRLRYSMTSQLLSNGVPLKTIADVLGHQSIDTTKRYIFINPKELSAIALPWPGRTSL